MLNKLKLLIGTTSVGIALCTVTSFPLTMNVKNYDYALIASETPILKDSISFTGSIKQLIKSDGRSEDVNSNLDAIFNGNKKALIENHDKVNQKVIDSLDFDTEILNWDDWGPLTFDQWKQQNQQQILEVEYSRLQNITFISKNQLKYFLENNIRIILANHPNAKLAKADFGINNNGDLLIPITNTSATIPPTKLYTSTNYNSSTSANNIILKIPSNKISFMPQIIVSGTYGNENSIEIEPKEVSFECEIVNGVMQSITFSKNALSKKEITLKDKGVKGNEILLYDKISDEDIFKALGWLDENSSLEEDHIDGDEMDVSLLNEEKIYSDLGINKTTDELFCIKIEFVNGENSRNANHNSYNGEYKILIETIDKSDYDISLKIKTYEVVAAINPQNNQITPLQLLVPNAYLLETNVDNDDRFMYVSLDFLNNKSIEMGWREATNTDTEVTMIKKNLSKPKIFNNFVKSITDAAKEKNISLYNGITLKYKANGWDKNVSDYKNLISLEAVLKKGFVYKNSFTINPSSGGVSRIYNYYSSNQKMYNVVTFRVNCSDTVNKATIHKNNKKTVKEVETALPN